MHLLQMLALRRRCCMMMVLAVNTNITQEGMQWVYFITMPLKVQNTAQ